MALNSRVLLSALFHIIFARSFLEISNGFETDDVDCLKSIKDSLEDPNGYLKDHGTSTTIPKVSSVALLGSNAGTLLGKMC